MKKLIITLIFTFLLTDCLKGQNEEIEKYSKIQYWGCTYAPVLFQMPDISGITYNWYTEYQGVKTLKKRGNTFRHTKNEWDATEYIYVRSVIGGIEHTEYRLTLKLSPYCNKLDGQLSDCAQNGTILFREDFGGNRTQDPRISPTPLPPGVTEYNFSTDNSLGFSNPNTYWILKYNTNNQGGIPGNPSVWHYNFSDHTFIKNNDITRGYMFMVDADVQPNKFYEYDIDGLCEDVKLYFSAWCANLLPSASPVSDRPELRFELSDKNNNILAVFCTGSPTVKSIPTWYYYGFEFELPSGVNSIKLKIYNNAIGSSGNDFVMDDIEIRLCVPSAKMTITGNTELNVGENVSFTATYNDNGVFSNNYTVPLLYRWQYKSPNGDDWITLKENRTTNNPLNETYAINNIRKSQEGFYRFTVSGPSFENFKNCYAATDPVFITVNGPNIPLIANNDTVVKFGSEPIAIDVLINDLLGDCDYINLDNLTIISGKEPTRGNATVTTNKTISYQVNDPYFTGKDSLSYEIKCGNIKSTATVYLTIVKYPDNISDANCVVDVNAENWSIREVPNSFGDIFSNLHIQLVGDIDEDNLPEILALANTENQIHIIKGDLLTKHTINIPKSYGGSNTLAGIARIQYTPNIYKSLIFTLSTSTGLLYAYDINGTNIWTSTSKFNTLDYGAAIQLVDLDGDGWTEIIAGNKVFAAETGKLLCQAGTNLGIIQGWGGSVFLMQSMAGDVLGNGNQQICIGNTIYSVQLNGLRNIDLDVQNKMIIAKTLSSPSVWNGQNYETVPLTDGTVQLADIDIDGNLDIIVSIVDRKTLITNSSLYIYVWSPLKNKIIASKKINRVYKRSIPFIGNIDKQDKYPEIVMIHGGAAGNGADPGYDKITALKYNPASTTGELITFWQMDHDDVSGSTGITLFDFNQDEISELVYRDNIYLRIINGSMIHHETKVPVLAPYDLQKINCSSATCYEYPVIADIDNDGQAEIIVTGNNTNGLPGHASTGPLRVFKAGIGTSWAPARKVWNQFPYNAVNINEDLTIPKYPLNPATVFPGKDRILGTTNDVRPYNGFLQQQTILNKYGTPLWLGANAQIISPEPTFSYYEIGDSLKISITIKNTGESTLQNPVNITVYKNSILPANAKTYAYPHSIAAEESKTITFTIKNAKVWFGTNNKSIKFIIRINDNGSGLNVQPVCDSSKVELNIPFGDMLYARNDTVTAKYNSVHTFNVLKNDQRGKCTNNNMTKFDTITQSGLHLGKIIINADSTFSYIANQGKFGIDSVDYYIKCGTDSSIARIYIFLPKPQSSRYIACPDANLTLGIENIPNVNYYWYNSDNTLAKSNSNTLDVIKDNTQEQYWYVESRYKNIIFPQHKIILSLSDNCGSVSPTGCADEGTIIWKEDFGGNEKIAPQRALGDANSHPLMGKTTYNYVTRTNFLLPAPNQYGLIKNIEGYTNQFWSHLKLDDHTSLNDTTTGYFLTFDADTKPGQYYEFEMNDLCSGCKLTFSAWLMNVNPPSYKTQVGNNYLYPVLKFIIEDINNNILTTFHTGEVPIADEAEWLNYSFDFEVPNNVTTVKVRVINDQHGTGASGNDFSIDDIEVRLCAPNADIRIDKPIICHGDESIILSSYIDDGSLGNKIEGGWFESYTGDINNPNEWILTSNQPIKSSQTGIINDELRIRNQKDKKIYYRYAVSTIGNINHINYRSMSDTVSLKIIRIVPVPDIRIQMCPSNSVSLMKYIDTAEVQSVVWNKIYSNIPQINPITGTIINANDLLPHNTYIYQYSIINQCTATQGKVFVTPIGNKTMYLPPDTIVICCENTEYIQINQIIGMDIPGSWALEPVSSMDKNYIVINSHGGVMYNGKLAYQNLGTNDTYKGENVRIVKFKFESADNSCIGKKEKVTTLILTQDITK